MTDGLAGADRDHDDACRAIVVARSLMRMSLALLDQAGRPVAAARLRSAVEALASADGIEREPSLAKGRKRT